MRLRADRARPAREARDWVGATLRALVLGSEENVLRDQDGIAIFGPPLLGVADGDDALFGTFREVVSPRHLLPREILRDGARGGDPPGPVRVVVWALPYTEEVRRSNRTGEWPSALYSQARNNAAALNERICRELVAALEARGSAAAAPILTGAYDAFREGGRVFSSSWSERHVAYAAGLGRFGLSGGLITAAGMAVRLGSVVTDLDLEPSPRPAGSHVHPFCLGERGTPCLRCVPRCPAEAIGRDGLDRERCYARRNAVRELFLEAYRERLELLPATIVKSGRRDPGYSLGCALCECGVPCEAASPGPRTAEAARHA